MNDSSDVPQDSGNTGGSRPHSLLRGAAYAGLAAAIAVVAFVGYRAVQEQASLRAGEARLVAQHGLIQSADRRLAPEYRDQDGSLVADPPDDPAELIDPDKIVVAYYEGDDDDTQRVDWTGFQELLGQATGKEVVGQPYLNSADEVAAVKEGRIHVIALHAADTPYLVNNAGFVPVAVLGTSEGASGNHLVVATNRKSDIRTLSDLRGKTLTCTRPDSITGYRSAIAVLARDEKLRPGVDYRTQFSFGQKASIEGLLAGEYEVAALSADKIAEMTEEQELKEGDLRVVYESQIVPRLALGHIYNLAPALAEKVTSTALEFDNAGAADGTSGGKPMRFVPVDYKRDFEFVRRIDNSFDPRIGHFVTRAP